MGSIDSLREIDIIHTESSRTWLTESQKEKLVKKPEAETRSC